jgi:hypothetical protein
MGSVLAILAIVMSIILFGLIQTVVGLALIIFVGMYVMEYLYNGEEECDGSCQE